MKEELINRIRKIAMEVNDDDMTIFQDGVNECKNWLDSLSFEEFKDIVKEIPIIPESFKHDSTEEKIYSKVSDIVLSNCFKYLGLKSTVSIARGDSADVIAESNFHGYSLVADAKCFRLSRSAKNQKDFKVGNLSKWRGKEHEFAVLVAPHFQYPQKTSQIYKEAIDENVCILSWEQLLLILDSDKKETLNTSLEPIWTASRRFNHVAVKDAKQCFIPQMNELISKRLGMTCEEFNEKIYLLVSPIVKHRGEEGIAYWKNVILTIQNLSKEEAINELIKEKKIGSKISTIKKYMAKVKGTVD